MMSMRFTALRLTLMAAVAFALLFTSTIAGPATTTEPAPASEPVPEAAEKELSIWEQAQAYYELAKESGAEVPGSAADWLKQDYENIGDWEYKVIRTSAEEPVEALETRLNKLGDDRWELLWVQPRGGAQVFILKRPVRNWISTVPLTDILKMISGGALGGDGE
jgi:hypothetical protein